MANTILNSAACATNLGNTGIPDCGFDPVLWVGGFLIPPTAEIPASALVSEATLQTFLTGKILEVKGKRWYPLPNGEAFTDSSADVTVQTLSGGAAIPVKSGDYDFIQQYLDGKLCVSNQLNKFNGSNYKFLGIDANGSIIGTKNLTKDGIAGIKLRFFYNYPFKLATATEVAQYRYRIAFKPEQINKYVAFVKTNDFNPLDLQGLRNVKLTFVSRLSATPAVITFNAKTCGGGNLADTFPTELTDVTDYVVTNTATGAAVTVTAASVDTSGNISLTLATSGGYNNTAGGMTVALTAANNLHNNGIDGYEGENTFTTPIAN